jgi:hypothetical protein
MSELYKKIAQEAAITCGEIGLNDAWIWEKTYADLIVKECIRIIKYGITRDGANTEKYKRSFQHITDIETAFGIKKE